MSTRFIQKFNSTDNILNFPTSAGIGVVGGVLYYNSGGGIVPIGGGFGVTGTVRVVNPADTSGASSTTIQAAVNLAAAGDTIVIAPGTYTETVTVPFATNTLKILGAGPLGSISIAPSAADTGALVINANDVTIVNLDLAASATTTAIAATVTGSRFRAYDCKFEGGAEQLRYGPGTNAQVTAHTAGRGGDVVLTDCEFAWGTKGIVFQGTDFGAATQVMITGSLFHNLTASSVGERVGSGGSAAVTFRNIWLMGNTFSAAEDGTVPTAWCLLNASNSNTGVAGGNWFPTALNSGKNLVSTAFIWTSNYHTGGVSTGQPS
jgi:hypothetical protein